MSKKSKKYKGKICVYCGVNKSTSEGDYVIARGFIPVEGRKDLPRVPACATCNNAKAKLEHYVTAILPFGSKTSFAKDMLTQDVPPRLSKNLKLKSQLLQGARSIWIKNENNLIVPSMSLPLRGDLLINLFKMIIRGWLTAIGRQLFQIIILWR